MKTLFLVVISLIFLSGCGLTTGSRLSAIDELLPEHPDSALSLLSDMHPSGMWLPSDKARYALLTSEARYYSGIDDRDDSLISIAASYYTLRDKNPLKIRAYYIKGIIQANDSNYSEALVSYMMGAHTAGQLGDTLRLALLRRSIGDTFDKMGRHQAAAAYYDKSYRGFKSLEDSVYTTYAIYDLARSYSNYAQYDSCIVKAKECLHYAEKKNDSTLIGLTLSLLGRAYESNNDNEDAIYHLNRLHREYPLTMNFKEWNSLGIAYLYSGNPIMAQQCEDTIKRITDEPSWLSYLLAQYNKDYKSALNLLKAEYEFACAHGIEYATGDDENNLYHQIWKIMEDAKNERKNQLLFYYSVIITLILLVFIISYLSHRNNRKHESEKDELSASNDKLESEKNDLEKEIEKNKNDIKILKHDISLQENIISDYQRELTELKDLNAQILNDLNESKSYNDSMQVCIDNYKVELDKMKFDIQQKQENINDKNELNELLSERLRIANSDLKKYHDLIDTFYKKLKSSVENKYELLDKLTKKYYEAYGMVGYKEKVTDLVQSIIQEIPNDKQLMKMENFVNANLDNLISDFKADFPTLNKYEYELYLFFVLHISTKSISVFQDVHIDNIYNRKANLIKKIKAKGDDTKRDYLKYI